MYSHKVWTVKMIFFEMEERDYNNYFRYLLVFVVIQSLSDWLCETPWAAAGQDLLSSTISQSSLIFTPIVSLMLSNYLTLCCCLFFWPSILPSIRVFPNESALRIRWPKYWSFSHSPSNEYSWLVSFRIDGLMILLSKGLSRVFSSTTTWKHQFFGSQPFLWSNSYPWLLEKPQLWLYRPYKLYSLRWKRLQ